MDPPTDHFTVSTDPARLDISLVHAVLTTSYWSPGIRREVVENAIAGSLCFGVYDARSAPWTQVGFGRVISDYATFAYIADVFILPELRGHGLGKRLIAAMRADPRLQGFRRWCLLTRDAHALYRHFGFGPNPDPLRFMEIVDRTAGTTPPSH